MDKKIRSPSGDVVCLSAALALAVAIDVALATTISPTRLKNTCNNILFCANSVSV
jgi:hypothetical protein